jgi:hypothetical protein
MEIFEFFSIGMRYKKEYLDIKIMKCFFNLNIIELTIGELL